VTSLIFVVGILGVVTYLSITKTDVTPEAAVIDTVAVRERGGLWQTILVVALVLIAAGTGYSLRKSSLQDATAAPAPAPAAQSVPGGSPVPPPSPLGDVSTFRKISKDTLGLLNAGDQPGATANIDNLETEWDNAEARLKLKNKAEWTTVDGKIDTVLRRLRATSPDPASEKSALDALLAELG
jgi:hypothetical protein